MREVQRTPFDDKAENKTASPHHAAAERGSESQDAGGGASMPVRKGPISGQIGFMPRSGSPPNRRLTNSSRAKKISDRYNSVMCTLGLDLPTFCSERTPARKL